MKPPFDNMAPDPKGDRLPPHSIEAEQGVLGCVLLDSSCIHDCIQRFKGGAQTFYDLRHQNIYTAMLSISESGKGIDTISIYQWLSDHKIISECGGMEYVSLLPDMVPSAANFPYYADILMDKFILRRLLGTITDVSGRVQEYEGDIDTLLTETERVFMEIGNQRENTRELSGRQFIEKAIDRIENYHRGHAQMIGISTGYDYVDKMTCGMAPGQLIVIAARPGLGKTSLAMNIVERVALDKKIPTAVITLEMTADELGARLMFQVARADYQRFRTGFFETGDIPALTVAAKRIGLAPLWIDEASSLNVLQVRSKARRMMQLYDIKFLVIDYLQLMVASRHFNNREQEVAEMSSGLKSLAKELKIPVMVLAQFNRDIEKEPNRKPRLSDLRESGRIEADADVVGMLYKPKLTAEQLEALATLNTKALGDWSDRFDRVNMLIAKQRNGPTGDCELEFHKSCMRFESHIRPKAKTTTKEPKE